MGVEARYSEFWVRACFQEHAQQLLCEKQRGSPALLRRPRADTDAPSADMVAQYLETLRAGKAVSDKEMAHMLTGLLAYTTDDARLCQLLALLPGSAPLGALAPIAGALFHPNSGVRAQAAALVRAFEAHQAARPCVSGLNSFLLSGLAQQPAESGSVKV